MPSKFLSCNTFRTYGGRRLLRSTFENCLKICHHDYHQNKFPLIIDGSITIPPQTLEYLERIRTPVGEDKNPNPPREGLLSTKVLSMPETAEHVHDIFIT